jgi:transposase-like protein
MPWSETTPMDQKTQFIADYLRQRLSMSELCDLYGISRKTGYKLVGRYLKQGSSGLEDRSRRPSSSPNHTPGRLFSFTAVALNCSPYLDTFRGPDFAISHLRAR